MEYRGSILTEEIISKKHRWFIWTIVIILVTGVALLAYVYITGINMEAEIPIISGVISKKGTIDITSDPAGAKIFLDDVDTGKTTYDTITTKTGTHTIKLTLEGYKDYVQEVEVKRGKIIEVSAILEKGEGVTTGTSVDETADWESYTNKEYGYEVKYPNDWKINIEDPKNVTLGQLFKDDTSDLVKGV